MANMRLFMREIYFDDILYFYGSNMDLKLFRLRITMPKLIWVFAILFFYSNRWSLTKWHNCSKSPIDEIYLMRPDCFNR